LILPVSITKTIIIITLFTGGATSIDGTAWHFKNDMAVAVPSMPEKL